MIAPMLLHRLAHMFIRTLFRAAPKGAAVFRQNQIKNDRSIVKTVFLSLFNANLKKSRLKTCGFLPFN